MKLTYTTLILLAACSASAATPPMSPTFTKDVAPILYEKCVICHRKGDIAPMQFLTYEQTRPWAKSIAEQVQKRTMPPWFASPEHGQFRNDRHLSDTEILTLVTWAKNGAPMGKTADMPPAPKLVEGWSGDRPPDLIVELPLTYKVPASGVLDMLNFYSKVPFDKEVWIEAVELRPQNRSVVHHSIVNVVSLPASVTSEQMLSGKKYGGTGWKLIGQAPGKGYEKHPEGVAKRIAPGQYFEFNMHYTPTGKDETDRSQLALWFAKGPIHHEVVTRPTLEQTIIAGKPASGGNRPKIPADAVNWPIQGLMTTKEDITLYSLSPHMHYRGHDMKYTVKYPDGREEVLLDVPHFDFDWQLNYEFAKPLKIPAGSTFTVDAHYDNTKDNAKNPDHTKEVAWGQQSWDEMFIPWAEWTVDKNDLTKMTKEQIEKLRNGNRFVDPEQAKVQP